MWVSARVCVWVDGWVSWVGDGHATRDQEESVRTEPGRHVFGVGHRVVRHPVCVCVCCVCVRARVSE